MQSSRAELISSVQDGEGGTASEQCGSMVTVTTLAVVAAARAIRMPRRYNDVIRSNAGLFSAGMRGLSPVFLLRAFGARIVMFTNVVTPLPLAASHHACVCVNPVFVLNQISVKTRQHIQMYYCYTK